VRRMLLIIEYKTTAKWHVGAVGGGGMQCMYAVCLYDI
jgi:hypothetical protein